MFFSYCNITKNNRNKQQLFITPFVPEMYGKLGSTLNYIDIMQPVYFNVFLHGY